MHPLFPLSSIPYPYPYPQVLTLEGIPIGRYQGSFPPQINLAAFAFVLWVTREFFPLKNAGKHQKGNWRKLEMV